MDEGGREGTSPRRAVSGAVPALAHQIKNLSANDFSFVSRFVFRSSVVYLCLISVDKSENVLISRFDCLSETRTQQDCFLGERHQFRTRWKVKVEFRVSGEPKFLYAWHRALSVSTFTVSAQDDGAQPGANPGPGVGVRTDCSVSSNEREQTVLPQEVLLQWTALFIVETEIQAHPNWLQTRIVIHNYLLFF